MTEKTIKVLLIEDDAEDTLILMELMAQSDWPSFQFTMSCSESLEEGLRLLKQSPLDVVLLDLMLPDSTGIETVATARRHAPDIPIVVLTGLKDESMGLEAVRRGAQDYQVKGSLDAHSLKRTISFAVERHRLVTQQEMLLEKSADGMVVVDNYGKMRYLNPAARTLFVPSGDATVGKPFPFHMPAGNSGEIRLPSESGTGRIAEMRIVEIEWRGQPALLASIRDITDLRRIEQMKAEIKERRYMDQIKDQLMSTVSHEIRNPLTVIKAAVDSLKEGIAGPLTKSQGRLAYLAHVNTKRLLKVVGNILDLSRLESGKSDLQRRRLDAGRLIRETVEGFRLALANRPILIEEALPADLPPLLADSDLFLQILSNLIDNALRFAKSKIVVRAAAMEAPSGASPKDPDTTAVLTARRTVQISVIDDGIGIPDNRTGDLFKKFVQINRREGEGYKGTGLGLALCKEIVERQDGRIWYENGPRGGAQFHFTLPVFDGTKTDSQGEGDETKRSDPTTQDINDR